MANEFRWCSGRVCSYCLKYAENIYQMNQRQINFHYVLTVGFVLICRYNVIVIIVSYAIPMFILIVTYTVVGIELWGHRAIGENTPVQIERIASKRRVFIL